METHSPKHNKAKTIAFRVTDEQHQHLSTFAKAEGYKNLSQWMHQLVKDEIIDRTASKDAGLIGDGFYAV
jgi:NADH:ubiquinone oxidoreductase subunit F (NADH-binding)